VGLTIDPRQYKTKIIIIIVLKPDSRIDSEKGISRVLGESTCVDSSQHKIKVVVIILLKPDSGVNSMQGPDHRSGRSIGG
jgi:ribulose bisphosphate carboxylase small subunit